MKSDLIITRFKTQRIVGTMDENDPKTFFGSKMIDIEDEIIVDNSKLQYSEVVYEKPIVGEEILFNNIQENNGYQFYNDIDNFESITLINYTDIKSNYNTMNLVSQTNVDLVNNTQWNILIDWKSILQEYLYFNLKHSRVFKTIQYYDVLSENINLYINDYITNNILNRYVFDRIDLYIKYYDLEDGDEHQNPNLLFNPIFDDSIRIEENIVRNVNSVVYDNILNVSYKQTEISSSKTFKYYYDIILRKL